MSAGARCCSLARGMGRLHPKLGPPPPSHPDLSLYIPTPRSSSTYTPYAPSTLCTVFFSSPPNIDCLRFPYILISYFLVDWLVQSTSYRVLHVIFNTHRSHRHTRQAAPRPDITFNRRPHCQLYQSNIQHACLTSRQAKALAQHLYRITIKPTNSLCEVSNGTSAVTNFSVSGQPDCS